MHQIQILKKYELSVKGLRGQHLLVDENIQRKFVSLVQPKPGETILEIGPGLGAITELILREGAKVIAVEHDPRFVQVLEGELGQDYQTLRLVQGDILKTDLKKFVRSGERLKVVGNIPYYITSGILLYLISFRKFIDSAYLTIQREVADRIFAQPGTKAYGRLSLLVRFYTDVHRAFEISRNCFSPKPNVDSTAITLNFRKTLPESIDETLLFQLIKFAFSARRKNIVNAIAEAYKISRKDEKISKDKIRVLLREAGLNETSRAEELMLKDFIRLTELFGKQTHSID